jgi:hypothetical protein
LQKLNLDIQLLKNSTTRLLMANSRVQQRVKDATTTLWRQHSPSGNVTTSIVNTRFYKDFYVCRVATCMLTLTWKTA